MDIMYIELKLQAAVSLRTTAPQPQDPKMRMKRTPPRRGSKMSQEYIPEYALLSSSYSKCASRGWSGPCESSVGCSDESRGRPCIPGKTSKGKCSSKRMGRARAPLRRSSRSAASRETLASSSLPGAMKGRRQVGHVVFCYDHKMRQHLIQGEPRRPHSTRVGRTHPLIEPAADTTGSVKEIQVSGVLGARGDAADAQLFAAEDVPARRGKLCHAQLLDRVRGGVHRERHLLLGQEREERRKADRAIPVCKSAAASARGHLGASGAGIIWRAGTYRTGRAPRDRAR